MMEQGTRIEEHHAVYPTHTRVNMSSLTSGCAPALSVRIREHLETAFGDEYAAFVGLMGSLRSAMAARYPAFAERRRRWYELVDSDLLALLRAGRTDDARRRIDEIAGPDVATAAAPALAAAKAA